MAHERLQRPGIDPACRKSVSGSVAQHVGVDWEQQLSGYAKPLYELLGAVDRRLGNRTRDAGNLETRRRALVASG